MGGLKAGLDAIKKDFLKVSEAGGILHV